ncbi:DUF721 domain-containing protein [Streptomyces nitrosporeus]|uniref:DUF721 domain-containing protein n=1 Tax=Streptomyces nitrosporeus TaxID=28894 RepID=UPI0039A338DB
MTTQSELCGVDLARQALLAAREAARKNGATSRKPKRRPAGTVVRRDGREPLGLGSAISRMMTERGMTAPAAGGSVLAGFDTLLATVAPELAGWVRAVGFDAETGRLDVVPDAPAVATKLRWTAPKLVAAATEKVPGANVRVLRVLAPAAVKAGPATAAEPAPPPTTPAAALGSAGGLPRGHRRPPRHLEHHPPAHPPRGPGRRRTATPRTAPGTSGELRRRPPGP